MEETNYFIRYTIGISAVTVALLIMGVMFAPSLLVATLFAVGVFVFHTVALITLAVWELRREFGQVI